MLKDTSSSAILAVADLPRARRFYEEVLQLDVQQASDAVVTYRTGATSLVLYVSGEAGTNRANAAVWAVGEGIEAIAADLASRGARFERYDLPDTNYADGVHRAGDFRMIWFKDPDGNILHLNSG